MKICLICEYFYPDNAGGTGTVLSSLVRHLKDTYADLEIDVITSGNVYRGIAEKLPALENWQGIEIHRLQVPKAHPSSIKKRLLTNFRFTCLVLKKMLQQRDYDLVLVSTAPPTMPMAAKVFKRFTGTPYAYIVYDLYPDIAVALEVLKPQAKPVRVLHKLQKGWLHSASKVIVLGRCMAEHLQQQYRLPAAQIKVIPVGADARKVSPLGKETKFREANGLKDFVVLWAGNFGWHQDFDSIIDAAKTLQASHKSINFVFVGDGAKREHIVKRLEQEKIANVRLLPFVDEADFTDMLASANVSLVALEPGAEGLGVPSKFYNILASGRPVVALVAPGSEVAHVIEENQCGVRVERNGEELAAVLADLESHPDKVKEMGERARQACEENYSMDHICHQFYSVFHSIYLAQPIASEVPTNSYGIKRKIDKPESLV
jgi:glycosyltransferase involved in cell wall biosynthesis